MKSLRLGLSALIVTLLGVGYAGSQIAALRGNAAEWASKVDQPAVVVLALIFLLLALALALAREPGETP